MTRCHILLGRFGDIIGILPMLHAESLRGSKSVLMVASEFQSVLDGVSYVDKVVYQGHHSEVGKAVDEAKSKGYEPMVLQLIGNREEVMKHSFESNRIQPGNSEGSFDREPWRMAGKLQQLDWNNLPLVFDKRDREREATLLAKCGFRAAGRKKPVILLSLGGNTSPFPYADLMRKLLSTLTKYRVVELPQAECIYDLLALYEKADLLIANDSAPLHLAQACPKLPVFALTQDKPSYWHGSAWKPNHYWYCRYHDWPMRAVEMLNEIDDVWGHTNVPESSLSLSLSVWSEYDGVANNHRGGNRLAIGTGTLGRDSFNTLKEGKRFPYLKDVLMMAFKKAIKDETWIFIERANVKVNMGHVEVNPPFYSYRISKMEYGEQFRPIVDVFCATKAWWKTKFKEIPDLIFGSDFAWSQCLWVMFKQAGAKDLTGISRYEPPATKKIWKGVESASSKFNSATCGKFVATSKVHSRYPKVSEQLECLPLETDKLMPFGYNPAIIHLGDKLRMVYRYHSGGASTNLYQSIVTRDGKVETNSPITLQNHNSFEDARLFGNEGKLCMSYVGSTMPNMPIRAMVTRCNIGLGDISNIVQDPLPKNDGSSIQKNWVYFSVKDRLFCIYQCHPVHSVYEITNGNMLHVTTAPKWPYGEIRGGTPPVSYEGKLLRFFHSRLMNEFGPFSHRYYVGAYLMNPEPPFEIVKVSKKPILYGSESGDLNKDQRKACAHWKPNCVLPFGAVERDGGWLVSVGVNDSACAIVKVNAEDLNL